MMNPSHAPYFYGSGVVIVSSSSRSIKHIDATRRDATRFVETLYVVAAVVVVWRGVREVCHQETRNDASLMCLMRAGSQLPFKITRIITDDIPVRLNIIHSSNPLRSLSLALPLLHMYILKHIYGRATIINERASVWYTYLNRATTRRSWL